MIVGTPCADTIHAPRGITKVEGEGDDDTLFGRPRQREPLRRRRERPPLWRDRRRSAAWGHRRRPPLRRLWRRFGSRRRSRKRLRPRRRDDRRHSATRAAAPTLSATPPASTPGFSDRQGPPHFFRTLRLRGLPAGPSTGGASTSTWRRASPTTAWRPTAEGSTNRSTGRFSELRDRDRHRLPRLHRRHRRTTETFYGGGGADIIDRRRRQRHRLRRRRGRRLRRRDQPANASSATKRSTRATPARSPVGLMAPQAGTNPALYLTGSDGADEIVGDLLGRPAQPVVLTVGGASGRHLPPSRRPPTRSLLAGLAGDDSLSASGFPETTSVVLLGGEEGDELAGGDTEDALVDGAGHDAVGAGGGDDAVPNNGGDRRASTPARARTSSSPTRSAMATRSTAAPTATTPTGPTSARRSRSTWAPARRGWSAAVGRPSARAPRC